jgi:hypothetical protein
LFRQLGYLHIPLAIFSSNQNHHACASIGEVLGR